MATLQYSDLGTALQALLLPLAIVLPRILAAFHVIPLFSGQQLPMLVRNALALSLAIFMYPATVLDIPLRPQGPMFWTVVVFKEVVLGLMIGYACSIFIWIIQNVGAMIDSIVGTNLASLFNPSMGETTGPFGILLGKFAVMLFVALGGMAMLIDVFLTSFVVWPPLKHTPQWSASAQAFFIQASADVLTMSVQLAMPVITMMVLVDLGLGLANRSANELNAYSLSMPLKCAGAVFFLAITLLFLADEQHPLRAWMRSASKFLTLSI